MMLAPETAISTGCSVARLYLRDPSPRRVCNHPLLERLTKEVPVLDWQVIEEGPPAHEARSQTEEANCFGVCLLDPAARVRHDVSQRRSLKEIAIVPKWLIHARNPRLRRG